MQPPDFSETISHLNNDHNDTVLFLGQTLGGVADITGAMIAEIDLSGLSLDLTSPSGEVRRQLSFETQANEPSQVREQLLNLVFKARSIAGGDGLTSIELELTVGAIRTFVATVSRVTQVSPSLRQITIQSDSLRTYSSVGPDDFVHVLIPPAGRTDLTIGEDFSWDAYAKMPPEEQPRGAYYTVREWRESGEVDIWFVLHGDHGALSSWAAAAKPGDPVALWGPRTSFEPPADTEAYLLVADETGLPALLNIVESAPPNVAVTAFVETSTDADHLATDHLATAHSITWLSRQGNPAGSGTGLLDAVRSLSPTAANTYAWGGAESAQVTSIRRHLRDELELDREHVSMIAYWRLAPATEQEQA